MGDPGGRGGSRGIQGGSRGIQGRSMGDLASSGGGTHPAEGCGWNRRKVWENLDTAVSGVGLMKTMMRPRGNPARREQSYLPGKNPSDVHPTYVTR